MEKPLEGCGVRETDGKSYFKKEAHVHVNKARNERAHWVSGKKVIGDLGEGGLDVRCWGAEEFQGSEKVVRVNISELALEVSSLRIIWNKMKVFVNWEKMPIASYTGLCC